MLILLMINTLHHANDSIPDAYPIRDSFLSTSVFYKSILSLKSNKAFSVGTIFVEYNFLHIYFGGNRESCGGKQSFNDVNMPQIN